MRILQIVPHLPPPFEGVGTYAAALAGALEARFGIETRFLVGDPAWRGDPATGARPVPARTAAGLLAGLAGAETVLLHYANYGYQTRGCPLWLERAVRRWRRGPGRRLVTFFHEIAASGPPWRSSFWLQPMQRHLAARMASLSQFLITSLELHREILRPWVDGREITVMPVFSTVGEPASVPSLNERARRIVVFGGAGIRGRAYDRFQPALAEAVRALAAEEVWDIGPALDLPDTAGGVPLRAMGVLSPAKVSEILLGSASGFLAYPPAFLPKSTIFAAYCAHGMLPICSWDGPSPDGVPAAGRHYWAGSGDPQPIASAAHDWYGGHSLARQTETFRTLLAGESAAGR
jgi:hypothetical protein